MKREGLNSLQRKHGRLPETQPREGTTTTLRPRAAPIPEFPNRPPAPLPVLARETLLAAKPRPAVPGATAKRAVVTAYCTEAQRSYFVSFRFNARVARFFVAAKTNEPPEQADRSIPLALLPLTNLTCLHCRNPLEQSTCNFRPTLVCTPVPGDDCPGFCRNLFGLG